LIAALSKPPTQTSTQKTLQKLILSHFHNIIHILSQLTDTEMLQLALGESAKILPYVVGSRKAIKGYLKVRFLRTFLCGGEMRARLGVYLGSGFLFTPFPYSHFSQTGNIC
jgi:hypothetical protein